MKKKKNQNTEEDSEIYIKRQQQQHQRNRGSTGMNLKKLVINSAKFKTTEMYNFKMVRNY